MHIHRFFAAQLIILLFNNMLVLEVNLCREKNYMNINVDGVAGVIVVEQCERARAENNFIVRF